MGGETKEPFDFDPSQKGHLPEVNEEYDHSKYIDTEWSFDLGAERICMEDNE